MDYQKILSDLDYICQKYEDISLTREVINSVNSNQLKCKSWLVDKCGRHFENNPRVLVAAGWFGLLGHLIKQQYQAEVTSFDMDPRCAEIGKIVFPEVKFESNFIENQNCSGYDVVICTSCEHFEDELMHEFLKSKDKDSVVILQSNNYYSIEDHVNCKDSLQSFVNAYSESVEVLTSYELDVGHYTRYMLVGF